MRETGGIIFYWVDSNANCTLEIRFVLHMPAIDAQRIACRSFHHSQPVYNIKEISAAACSGKTCFMSSACEPTEPGVGRFVHTAKEWKEISLRWKMLLPLPVLLKSDNN